MERCGVAGGREGGVEMAARRFKASAKEINHKSADAIVSVQTGCRTYQLEQEAAGERRRTAWRRRRRRSSDRDKDNHAQDGCEERRRHNGAKRHFERGC